MRKLKPPSKCGMVKNSMVVASRSTKPGQWKTVLLAQAETVAMAEIGTKISQLETKKSRDALQCVSTFILFVIWPALASPSVGQNCTPYRSHSRQTLPNLVVMIALTVS